MQPETVRSDARSMLERFRDKVIVVWGGNSGIGLASAKAFASEGARVIITGRDPATLQSSVREIGPAAIAHRCDVCDLGQIAGLYGIVRRDYGRIDVLFANAGVFSYEPIELVTEDAWDRVHDTNLKGVFFSVQGALPLMSMGSAIVLTGSVAGAKALPNAVAYAASKAGLRSLGRSLAAALVGRGIRVNVVSPAATETPLWERAQVFSNNALSSKEEMIDGMPMKRMARPEEVAAAVLYLASDAAGFITGIDLPVDSGLASF